MQATARRTGSDTAPVLVGRVAEQTAMSRLLTSMSSGASALVFSGSPGVGKSSVWQLGVVRFQAVAEVLACRPTEIGSRLSYLGLSDLFDIATDVVDERVEEHRADGRRALRSRGGMPGRGGADAVTVGLAVVEALERLIDRPVVLAVDDLHWLDPGTARVLGFALRRLSSRPIGVLATQRGDGVPGFLRAALGPDRVEMHPMEALSVDEVDAVLQQHFGVAFRRETLVSLHQASGGNPLYALELARAELRPRAPRALPAARELPASLQELLEQRIRALGSGPAEALLVVALAGTPTADLVAKLLGSHGSSSLLRAMDAGLVESDNGRLRFTHPLLAAAAYAMSEPGRRRRLQLAQAALVDDPEEKGRLLATAVSLPDAEAAAVVETAAEAAACRGAPDSAALLAERAAELTPAGRADDWARRLGAAADYAWDAGDHERCLTQLQALSHALPRGSRHAEILRRLAVRTVLTTSFASAVPMLERALQEAGDDVAIQAAVRRDLALAQMQQGDVGPAERLAAEALALARQSGDQDLLADAEVMVLLHAVIAKPIERVDRFASRLIELSGPEGHDRWLLAGSRLVLTGAMLKWLDRFDAARDLLTRALRERWDRQEDGLLYAPLFQLAELECWAGRYSEVERLQDIAERTERRVPDRETARGMRLYPAALVAARRGAMQAAAQLAAEGLAVAKATSDGRNQMRCIAVLGFLALTKEEHDEAVTALSEVAALEEAFGYAHPGVMRSSGDLVEALVASGRLDEAETRLAACTRRAARAASDWGVATALRGRGLLHLARDEKREAVHVLASAAESALHQPDPFETMRTHLALGQALRRDRHRVQARSVLQRAVDLGDDLGAAAWQEMARVELARCGGSGKPRSSRDPGVSPALAALTPMQATIAELVAAGRGNGEIAAQLYISTRTVEAHLSAIYRQLRLRNRTELAAHVHAAQGSSAVPAGSNRRDSPMS